MKATTDLLIVAPADGPLAPAQRKFNQLLTRIEQARAELLAWQEQRSAFAQAYTQRTQPLNAAIAACRLEVVTRLDTLAGQGKWTKTERRTLDGIVCEVVADLLGAEPGTEAHAARLKALYDKHAEVDFDTENRESVAVMKGMFEAMSGLDLGDEAFASEEDLLHRARERFGAEREAERQRAERAPSKPARKKTAAQRRREAEEREVSQSVREVYRKLVSALHPDRADDEADRTRRTALMQRVNRAYEAKDLLALFALQLEIEQVDAAHLARATAERAAHYNQLLTAQLSELKAELESCELSFIVDFGDDIGLGPNEVVRPGRLGKLLDLHIAELNVELSQVRQDTRQLQEPVAAKRWLKKMRQHHQAMDDDLFS